MKETEKQNLNLCLEQRQKISLLLSPLSLTSFSLPSADYREIGYDGHQVGPFFMFYLKNSSNIFCHIF